MLSPSHPCLDGGRGGRQPAKSAHSLSSLKMFAVALAGVCLAFQVQRAGAVVVTDLNTCARVGAPKAESVIPIPGCDFNQNVLQNVFASNSSCEPSQAWMNQSGMFDFYERFYNSTDPSLVSFLWLFFFNQASFVI